MLGPGARLPKVVCGWCSLPAQGFFGWVFWRWLFLPFLLAPFLPEAPFPLSAIPVCTNKPPALEHFFRSHVLFIYIHTGTHICVYI